MRAGPFMIAAAGLLAVFTAGCGYFGSKNAGVGHETSVAVLDLDSVAKQLGYDVQIVGAMRQQKASLEQQLEGIKASYIEELGKRKNQIGDKPTEQQTQYLVDSERLANVSLNQQKVKATRLLNMYSSQLIKGFRDRVKTTARDVASEKGLSIILTKNDSVVFDYNTAVDITDAVVEKMRAEQAAAPAVADAQLARATTESGAGIVPSEAQPQLQEPDRRSPQPEPQPPQPEARS